MTTAEDILSKYDEQVSTLGFQLRKFLLTELKEIIEYPDGPANIIVYGFGPGYKQLLCTIIPSKKGIKLGFYKGIELPDPKRLLRGSGKIHRHVAIKSENDVKDPAMKKLLNEALKAYEKRVKAS
jgi:Domain of unknown function (DU1801)